jgi:hypothetical protein
MYNSSMNLTQNYVLLRQTVVVLGNNGLPWQSPDRVSVNLAIFVPAARAREVENCTELAVCRLYQVLDLGRGEAW